MKLYTYLSLILPFFLTAGEQIVSLGALGSIRYVDDGTRLTHIDRLSGKGRVMYTHTYHYNENNQLVSEDLIGDLGTIIYSLPARARSPYHEEDCEFDEQHNLVRHHQDGVIQEYTFNHQNEFVLEDSKERCEYDDAGNLIQKGDTFFTYDDQHKLLKVVTRDSEVTFTYNDQGMRSSKTVNGDTETYIYSGINEVAILDQEGSLKQLRIPGLSAHPDFIRPIAIETREAIYAPIHSYNGTIIKLVDLFTKEVISLSKADPFGRNLSKDSPTPWIFSGKPYDPVTDLVYFGHRYYSPDLKKWLTPDPAQQTADPYQYCFNNPYSFIDPDGRWTVSIFNLAYGATAVLTCPLWAPNAMAVGAGIIVGYLAYEGTQQANAWYNARQQEKLEPWILKNADRLPPYNGQELGIDPTVCPGEGFEWKGKGPPGSNLGSWVKGPKGSQEILHPDLNHPGPIGPHWDYEGPEFPEGIRLFPNGTWSSK